MASPIGLDPGYIAALARLRARNSLLELVGPARRDEVDAIRWQIDPWSSARKQSPCITEFV